MSGSDILEIWYIYGKGIEDCMEGFVGCGSSGIFFILVGDAGDLEVR